MVSTMFLLTRFETMSCHELSNFWVSYIMRFGERGHRCGGDNRVRQVACTCPIQHIAVNALLEEKMRSYYSAMCQTNPSCSLAGYIHDTPGLRNKVEETEGSRTFFCSGPSLVRTVGPIDGVTRQSETGVRSII